MRDGFPGYMQVNGLQCAYTVEIFSTGTSLHFRPGNRPSLFRRSIDVSPMAANRLVTDVERMRSGFSETVRGNQIGTCSEGPLGHPGDGEFLVWPILEFTISARYTYQQLTLGLSGRTGVGNEVHRGEVVNAQYGEQLQPWSFQLEIRLPREVIADVLRLESHDKYSLYEKLEHCRDAA